MLALPDKSKKKAVNERRDKVNRLLLKGATQKEIANQLKISIATVERDVKAIKEMSSVWLDDLAQKGIVHEWKISLDKLKDTERNLNQILQDPSLPRDDKLRVLKQRDENIALQSLKEMGKAIGTLGGGVKRIESGVVGLFQGFSPEQIENVERKMIGKGKSK